MIRVNHISSAHLSGGAARAGYRLHHGLLLQKQISKWLDCSNSPSSFLPKETNKIAPAVADRGLLQKVLNKLVKDPYRNLAQPGITPRSSPMGWGKMHQLDGIETYPDVWNFHWVSWFLEWEKLLPELARRAPIVWTLHDLNPLRGIWHYEPSFEEASHFEEIERRAFAFKLESLRKLPKHRLVFVGPSKWITDQCRESQITSDFNVVNIPYGVDTTTFAPRNGCLLREMFNIDLDSRVVGFVADDLSDPRKGIRELVDALKRIGSIKNIHLLSVGRSADAAKLIGIPHTHLGVLTNDHLLSHFYSTCDLFACPSLQDNLPNTVLESMACGTPVVGFDVGGIRDMVRPSISGMLCRVGDVDSLSSIIDYLIQDNDLIKALSAETRSLVENEYTLELQARRYIELYESLVKAK